MKKILTLTFWLMSIVITFGQFSGAGAVTMNAPLGSTAIQWYEQTASGANEIVGQTGISFTANTAGVYYATFTSNDVNCTGQQQTVFTVIALAGTTVSLNAGANNAGASNYQWKNAGVSIAGSTNADFTASTGGLYSTGFSIGSCLVESDAYYVFFLASPTSCALVGSAIPGVK